MTCVSEGKTEYTKIKTLYASYTDDHISRESSLERFIKEFVLDKLGESVDLHLGKDITVKHITRKGSIILASFWANVLQHEDNLPAQKFPYKKFRDRRTGLEKLAVESEGITFLVHMSNGTLVIQGQYVYDWFVKRFRELLDNFDKTYSQTYYFQSTVVEDMPVEDEQDDALNDPNTETEDYLLLQRKQHSFDDALRQRIEQHTEDLVPGIGSLAFDQVYWEGSALDQELDSLKQGAVKDGFTYLYTLWKSLLNRWFADDGRRVYMSSPLLDTDRLADIVGIYLTHRPISNLEACFVRLSCDGTRNAMDVKKSVLSNFSPKLQTYVEYKIFRKIVYPVKNFHARFVAGVKDGVAQVLMTSANFHGDHFLNENMETVIYLEMEEDAFLKGYVDPIATPVVGTTM